MRLGEAFETYAKDDYGNRFSIFRNPTRDELKEACDELEEWSQKRRVVRAYIYRDDLYIFNAWSVSHSKAAKIMGHPWERVVPLTLELNSAYQVKETNLSQDAWQTDVKRHLGRYKSKADPELADEVRQNKYFAALAASDATYPMKMDTSRWG